MIERAGTTGGIDVDAFGACIPSLCEFGRAPAVIYGTSIGALTGDRFQVNIDAGFARWVLLGQLKAGPTLVITGYTAITDGSGRKNLTFKNTFKPVAAASSTIAATPVTDYVAGNQPRPVAGLLGVWTNTDPSTGYIARLEVSTAADGSLRVHELGACGGGTCENGTVPGVTYGASTTSRTASKFIASFNFGYSLHQVVASYSSHTGVLTVASYTQYVDASGRSNVEITDTFQR